MPSVKFVITLATRRGLAIAAAMAGFSLVCILGMRFYPPMQLPNGVREKIALLAGHGDEYDAIFLGSSRIQNHIKPALFDRLLAEKGIPMKSLNFGISSMHTPEDDYVLDLILAQNHARLRWVFVELDFFQTDVKRDQADTIRGLYWHDWTRFLLMCRRLTVAAETGVRRNIRDAFERWDSFLEHSELFCERSANAGRGVQLADQWLFHLPSEPLHPENLGQMGDGWVPAVEQDADRAARNSGRLANILKERLLEPPKKDSADPVSQGALAAMLEKIERAGARPVGIIPPRARQTYFYPEPALARRVAILDFCKPDKYPEFYRMNVRIDPSHLNEAGAEIFTRLTADEFAKLVRRQ